MFGGGGCYSRVCFFHFVFSVSVLTVFQSWFHREVDIVFFSDIILFIISIFIFSSVMFVPLCLAEWCFGYYYSAFRFGWKFLVFLYLASWLLYQHLVDMFPYIVCWCISNISWWENQPFFIIIIICSVSLWLVLNFANLTRFPSFFFPTLFLFGCSQNNRKFIVFPSPFSALKSLIQVVTLFVACVSKKRSANNRKMPNGSPMLAIMTSESVIWVPPWVMFRFVIFFSCGYTTPSGCLLYALLTQMWPRTLTVRELWSRSRKKPF